MALELKNITKRYGKKVALDGFSYTFESGIFGMLGANGAGKSTMMNLITDNVKWGDGGEILYNGVDVLALGRDFHKVLGYMPQQQGMYESMSAYGFLMYVARLKALSKNAARRQVEELLNPVSLSDAAYKKLSSFSGRYASARFAGASALKRPKGHNTGRAYGGS